MTLQVDSELIELRTRIRHSAAHVMADVVKTLFPDAKIGIGPPTDDGFYYDFMVENPFTPEDVQTNREPNAPCDQAQPQVRIRGVFAGRDQRTQRRRAAQA